VQPEERLFRSEWGRLVTALTRIFGLDNLAIAEDVVQDVFCRAVEVWKLRGVPENPSAWLMTSARNRAIDLLRRERKARSLVPELRRQFESEWTLVPTVAQFFTSGVMEDDQLRMMFSCCDPALAAQTQVGLILNLLCGFSVAEIANAFLTKYKAMEKRIARGKAALADSKTLFDFDDEELPVRLDAVHRAVYLLFNEGYHSSSAPAAVRMELCREAMRLGRLISGNAQLATAQTYALCALMWLSAARVPGRMDAAGELLAFADQDRTLWDRQLIAEGTAFLERSAFGPEASTYHWEAAIACLHARTPDWRDTDWGKLVWLYDQLLQVNSSPVVALNRAIAVGYRDGPRLGIEAIEAIPHGGRLERYPFLPAALGEFELAAGRPQAARSHFERALSLARTPLEQRFLERRVLAAAERSAQSEIVDGVVGANERAG